MRPERPVIEVSLVIAPILSASGSRGPMNSGAAVKRRCARCRITNSHMELSRLCGWLSSLDLSQCRELYLLHLSDSCSNEGRFVDEVERCVPKHVRVTACPKQKEVG